jgi:hypothetical protein
LVWILGTHIGWTASEFASLWFITKNIVHIFFFIWYVTDFVTRSLANNTGNIIAYGGKCYQACVPKQQTDIIKAY